MFRWGRNGTRNLFMKALGLFMSDDKMVGKDLELGLARLKDRTEIRN